MIPFKDDHFYRQFDNYPEGQERSEAIARHAAHLLNGLHQQRKDEADYLMTVLQSLAKGESTVAIAIDIQTRLLVEFERRYTPHAEAAD